MSWVLDFAGFLMVGLFLDGCFGLFWVVLGLFLVVFGCFGCFWSFIGCFWLFWFWLVGWLKRTPLYHIDGRQD